MREIKEVMKVCSTILELLIMLCCGLSLRV